MRARGAALLLLAVLAASCTSGAAGTGAGVILAYAYQPGDALAYDLDASMDMEMTAEGNEAAAAMNADMVMAVTARLDLAFAAGPEPGTVEITVTQDLLEGGARLTSMGQEVLVPLADLAPQMEQEVVLVVDATGRPLTTTVGGIALPAQFLSGASSFGGSSLLTPQQFGPQFPETGLAVGTSWETEQSADLLGLSFHQRGEHRVVAEEQVAGRTVYRIDSRVTTGAIHTDLADLMAALAESPELLGGADPAQLDQALAQFDQIGVAVDIVMEESTATMTTWFDPVAGLVVRAVMETPMTMTMAMRGVPGGDVEVVMGTTTEQRLELAA